MRVQGFDQRWRKGSTTAPTKQPDSGRPMRSVFSVGGRVIVLLRDSPGTAATEKQKQHGSDF